MNAEPGQDAARQDGWIASDTTGRLRVRLTRERRTAEGMARAADELRDQRGISGVEFNRQTGSIIVHYDPTRRRDDILAMLRDAGFTIRDVGDADDGHGGIGRSALADSVVTAVNDLDRRLSELTGRQIDVKVVFPLALAAFGLWRALAAGIDVPAHFLLWHAFDTFHKYNAHLPPQRRE